MKTIISIGDFIDSYHKVRLNDFRFLLNRLIGVTIESKVKRTWSYSDDTPSEWWIIPKIHQRWNRLITGDPNQKYSDYLIKTYFQDRNNIRLLSPGCGVGDKEIAFAKYSKVELIEAFDISEKNINKANEKKSKYKYDNINFFVGNLYKFDFGKKQYDMVMFDSSLHHFDKIEEILEKIKISLKENGLFVINEYVGPNLFQWSNIQLKAANNILKTLPIKYRKRKRSNSVKSKIYRPGTIRMFLSDPSEAIASEDILPTIRKYFNVVEEKMFGGNILSILLKDISHNFLNDDQETVDLLDRLFSIEDNFMKENNCSDYIFGIYKK